MILLVAIVGLIGREGRTTRLEMVNEHFFFPFRYEIIFFFLYS